MNEHDDRHEQFGKALVANLNRNVTAEAVLDEMAKRQGHWYGPTLSWHEATEDFKKLFLQAYVAKPGTQDCDEFAREFVDQWPEGVAALRLGPECKGEIAQPPYAKNGLWPAFLRKRRPGDDPNGPVMNPD